eukprot:UN15431
MFGNGEREVENLQQRKYISNTSKHIQNYVVSKLKKFCFKD